MEKVSFAMSIGAFLISIGTAFLSYRNYQRFKKRQLSDTYSKLYADNNQFRKIFIDNPSFRKYFFYGSEVKKGDNDFEKASAIAEVIINYLEHLIIHSDNKDIPYMIEWEGLVDQFKENSPILLYMVNESKTIKVTRDLKGRFNAELAGQSF